MGITTTHKSIVPEERWIETVEGATPNSVSISTNAKGQAQIEVKLYFATPDELEELAAPYLRTIINQLRGALAEAGIPLASAETKSSTKTTD